MGFNVQGQRLSSTGDFILRAWKMEYQLVPSLEEEKLCFRVRSEGFPAVLIFLHLEIFI